MILTPLSIAGAMSIRSEPIGDERGWFARTWCENEFADAGVAFAVRQMNMSQTLKRGAVRGLHFQRAPHADAKVVRCLEGAIHEVISDLRPESPTFLQWQAVRLDDPLTAVYLPPGCAQGFQSLTDRVLVQYLMGEIYVPELYDGVSPEDPALRVAWPLPISLLSERDRSWRPIAEREDLRPRARSMAPA